MDRDIQELLVLIKAAPYIEQFIKNKYKDLREQKIKAVEKHVRQNYGYLKEEDVSISRNFSISKDIRERFDKQFGSKEEIDDWEQEELGRLYGAICSRTWTIFPELLENNQDEKETKETNEDRITTNR